MESLLQPQKGNPQSHRHCVTSPGLSGIQQVSSEAANLDVFSSDALTGGKSWSRSIPDRPEHCKLFTFVQINVLNPTDPFVRSNHEK